MKQVNKILMKNIFLLLTCLCFLQACKDDDKDVNWTPDALTVSCNETLTEAGSGNWKVTLPTEYKGSVKLDIQTDKAWEVVVSYMTTEEEKWITPSVDGAQGATTLTLAIADNATSKDRKASVVITTKGDIPVKKTITIIQGNVDELLTIGTIDENLLPEDLNVVSNADGSLKLTLSKGFTGELNVLTYSGRAVTPQVQITYPNQEQKDWITLTEAPAPLSAQSADVKTLSLTIGQNTDNVYREAVVSIVATAGELTVTRKVEVAQFGVEKINWNEEYCQHEREFIVSAAVYEKLPVATCENFNLKDLEISGGNSWLTLTQEEGTIYAKVLANISTNKERTTEIGLKNKTTGQVYKMPFRQCMQGYGIILSKSLWKLAAYAGQNTSAASNVSSYFKLFDNFWPGNKAEAEATYQGSKNTHIEVRNGTDADPVQFTFDLGEEPRKYNSMGLMPRLQWNAPSPKTVMIEVSDNLQSGWVTVVEKVTGNAFTEAELKGSTNTFNDHYEGIVHWFNLGQTKLQKRYIRLSMYETFWNGSLCLDEVFVSER